MVVVVLVVVMAVGSRCCKLIVEVAAKVGKAEREIVAVAVGKYVVVAVVGRIVIGIAVVVVVEEEEIDKENKSFEEIAERTAAVDTHPHLVA